MQNERIVLHSSFCICAIPMSMRSNTNSITFPLVDAPWVLVCTGIAVLLIGCACLGALISEAVYSGFDFFMLPVMAFAALCLWLGLKCLAKSQIRVHLVPEGIALSLLGYTFRAYPAEDLKLACLVDKGPYRETYMFLCISCYDLQELALLRQQRLQKNPYTRTNLPFRQRKGGWQRTFAGEYLRSRIGILPWDIPRKEMFCILASPEPTALVEQMFPDLLWEDLKRPSNHADRKPPVPDIMKSQEPETPEKFLQCHRHGEMVPLLPVALVICPFVLLLFCGLFLEQETVGVVLAAASIVWLFGSLLVLAPLDWKWVSAREDGIRVRWIGGEERFLSQADIRTVCCFSCNGKWGVSRYMAVTKQTSGEMTARQESHMNRSKRSRELLSAYSLAKNWPLYAQRRYLSRRMLLLGYWNRELLILAYTPERETWLKECYPQAEWMDMGEIISSNLF